MIDRVVSGKNTEKSDEPAISLTFSHFFPVFVQQLASLGGSASRPPWAPCELSKVQRATSALLLRRFWAVKKVSHFF